MEGQHPRKCATETQCKILIIDDDAEDYQLTHSFLKEAKGQTYAVDWASGYETGKEKLFTGHYDAVLVDYDLGQNSGIQLIREANERGITSPLILYTGRGNYEVDVEAMQAGATLYLAKNEANPLLLERIIRYAIELKQKEQAMRESEQRYAALFNTKTNGIAHCRIITNEQGQPVDYVILQINDAYEEITGLKRENVEGRRAREVIPGLDNLPYDYIGICGKVALEGGDLSFDIYFQELQRWFTVFVHCSKPGEFTLLFSEITRRKMAEQALQVSQTKLKAYTRELEAILDAVPAYVWITHDRDAREMTGNQLVYDLLNSKPGENISETSQEPGISRRFTAMRDGREIPPEELPVQHVAATGKPLRDYEFDMIFEDGSCRHLIGNVSPLLDENGEPAGAVSAFIDITSLENFQKQLIDSENRFRVALASAPITVFTTDRNLRITWMYDPNPAFQLDRVIGRRLDEITPEEHGQALTEILQSALESGQSRHGEIETLAYGVPAYFVYYVDPIRDPGGLVSGLACAGYDITERKQVEAEIQRYAAELERSNQALSDFAAFASHDLQEPLRKIIMFSKNLRSYYADSLVPETEDYIKRMQNAAERMQVMVKGLLDLSRVNTRGGQFVPTNLTQVVESVVNDYDLPLKAAQGQVIIGELPAIEADEMQLYEVFQNLISNAVKFHRPGIPPVVQISAKTRQTKTEPIVEIRVADNGIGMDPNNIDRIFQPFTRLHGKNEYEGTGLGLAICQKIIERHRGKIEVRSVPDQGTTFIIRLPLKARTR